MLESPRTAVAALEAAGMTTRDIVKPALMLSVVTQLIKPGILVEIELLAAAR